MLNLLRRSILIIVIIFIAAFIRLYQLGSIPHGITWDEAAIGYNGYAVLTTRRDEWLQKLPVSFRSFGDYKAPLAIYLNGPFTYLLGMNAFAVRFPFALASLISIFLMYVLLKEIRFLNKEHIYPLIGAALLALNPWHIHFSRIGFESGLALTFLLASFVCIIKAYRLVIVSKKFTIIKYSLAFSAGVFLSASMYAYHSAKLVVPLLCLSASIIFYSELKKNLRLILVSLLSFVICLYPLIKDSIYGKGLERASVSVFSNHTFFESTIISLNQLLTHLSPTFLIFGATNDLRHGDSNWGVLLPSDLFILVIAVFIVINRYKKIKLNLQSKVIIFAFAWLIIGILPAAISQDVPHSNRALLALPAFIILITTAYYVCISYFKTLKGTVGKKQLSDVMVKLASGTMLFVHCFFAISYINSYFTSYAKKSERPFLDGYIQAFELAKQYEKGENGKQQVDKIIFTSEYGQPYIYALFVRRTNPIWYQGGSLIKYEFTDSISEADLSRDNALVVAGEKSELDEKTATHIIKGSDNKTRFKLYLTKDIPNE